MRSQAFLAGIALLLVPGGVGAQQVEKVRAGTPGAPGLPDDLFRLPPGQWAFASQLWAGNDPCTVDQCEAGYTSGDLVVSVERSKEEVRIVGGFRNCPNVAWNELHIGGKPSKSDTRLIAKRMKTVLATSAKYCKVTAPTLPPLDAAWLFPPKAAGQ
jgi:hypothetical protein